MLRRNGVWIICSVPGTKIHSASTRISPSRAASTIATAAVARRQAERHAPTQQADRHQRPDQQPDRGLDVERRVPRRLRDVAQRVEERVRRVEVARRVPRELRDRGDHRLRRVQQVGHQEPGVDGHAQPHDHGDAAQRQPHARQVEDDQEQREDREAPRERDVVAPAPPHRGHPQREARPELEPRRSRDAQAGGGEQRQRGDGDELRPGAAPVEHRHVVGAGDEADRRRVRHPGPRAELTGEPDQRRVGHPDAGQRDQRVGQHRAVAEQRRERPRRRVQRPAIEREERVEHPAGLGRVEEVGRETVRADRLPLRPHQPDVVRVVEPEAVAGDEHRQPDHQRRQDGAGRVG